MKINCKLIDPDGGVNLAKKKARLGLCENISPKSPLRNRAHRKASPEKSGVPMMLCGSNDLGMRLQTLTANFGRFRSELTNSQTGVVKFRFASV